MLAQWTIILGIVVFVENDNITAFINGTGPWLLTSVCNVPQAIKTSAISSLRYDRLA